jgi:hypothetical protein
VPEVFFVELGTEINVASTSGPALRIKPFLAQDLIDQCEHLHGQTMRFEQVTKPENRKFPACVCVSLTNRVQGRFVSSRRPFRSPASSPG